MKVEFTKHFWEKWKDRREFFLKQGVNVEKIIEFANNPDIILPDDIFPNRKWHIKKVEERCLKIVVEVKEDKLIIITAYFDRTLKRRRICG